MTHDEMPSHDKHGRRDRVGVYKICGANEYHGEKWLVVSEKPGDIARKVCGSEAAALQICAELKEERGIV